MQKIVLAKYLSKLVLRTGVTDICPTMTIGHMCLSRAMGAMGAAQRRIISLLEAMYFCVIFKHSTELRNWLSSMTFADDSVMSQCQRAGSACTLRCKWTLNMAVPFDPEISLPRPLTADNWKQEKCVI